MRDVYSRYWITAREKIYGFLEYDRNLCRYICRQIASGGKLLEVAIGTGYPFADFFQKAGYAVYGIDISPALIEKCRQLNPSIDCKVGDAEALEYPDDYFDCSYCFHSSWYFPDLNKAIDEMLRVTRAGGLVMFDIQNRNNEEIAGGYRKALSRNRGTARMIRYAKEVVGWVISRGEVPMWHRVAAEVPTYPESIYAHLREKGVSSFLVMVRHEDESIGAGNEIGALGNFARLVFAVVK